jgi:ABC-type dipeptide/oligopeptide/nickel transport system permease component
VLAYLARRLLLAVPTLFGVLAVTFLLLFVAPGDPVQEMVGERADAATIARLRRELRLDEPLPKQFAAYAGGVLRGDLGRSFITGRPIARDVAERFPKTLLLAGTAMVFASAAGIALGVVSARRPGGWADRLALGGAYLGISFPVYWVGLLLIVFFAVQLRWLPGVGVRAGRARAPLPGAAGARARHALGGVPRPRHALGDARGARQRLRAHGPAKGLAERAVVFRHGLRNALIPVVTVLGLDFGYYLTGSILTETIFSWPGIGRYVVNAISRRDLPAIQGSVLFLSAVFVLVNLLTDVAYAKADPRVRYD